MPYVTRDAFAFSKKQSHFRSLRRRKKPRHAEPKIGYAVSPVRKAASGGCAEGDQGALQRSMSIGGVSRTAALGHAARWR